MSEVLRCQVGESAQPCPGLVPATVGSRARGNSAPLLCSGETCRAVSSSGIPIIKRVWSNWNESRGEGDVIEGWSSSAVVTGWGTWGCSAWR